MSDLTITELWFRRAWKKPAEKQSVQVGVHLEEVAEMLGAVSFSGPSQGLAEAIRLNLKAMLELAADNLKKGEMTAVVTDKESFVDACADQIVTAVGSGFAHGCNVPLALERVNSSNFSKFDENGMPIFDENGKVAKNKATYKKADFTGCYYQET